MQPSSLLDFCCETIVWTQAEARSNISLREFLISYI
jgi:hypothetical protein